MKNSDNDTLRFLLTKIGCPERLVNRKTCSYLLRIVNYFDRLFDRERLPKPIFYRIVATSKVMRSFLENQGYTTMRGRNEHCDRDLVSPKRCKKVKKETNIKTEKKERPSSKEKTVVKVEVETAKAKASCAKLKKEPIDTSPAEMVPDKQNKPTDNQLLTKSLDTVSSKEDDQRTITDEEVRIMLEHYYELSSDEQKFLREHIQKTKQNLEMKAKLSTVDFDKFFQSLLG